MLRSALSVMCGAVALVLAFATAASATIISSSTQNSSSKIPFVVPGTLVGAAMFNGNNNTTPSIAPAVYDGISFSVYSATQSTTPLNLNFGVTSQTQESRQFANGYRDDVAGADQYRIRARDDSNIPVGLRFLGLDTTKTYQFQFGFFAPDGAADSSFGNAKLYDDDHPMSPTDYNNQGTPTALESLVYGGTAPGINYAKLDVFVTGTNEFSLGLERGEQQLNAFSVHLVEESADVVPEPASIALWSLLGVVTLGFGAWRRRRR